MLHLAKRRRMLCSEFVAITSSDAAVASSFMAGNDWHLQVLPGAAAGARRCPGGGDDPFPAIRLCVSEGAERLFRVTAAEGGGGGGGGDGGRRAAGQRGARELVGDPRDGGG